MQGTFLRVQRCPDGLSSLLHSIRKHLAEIQHHPSDQSDDSAPTKRQNYTESSYDASCVAAVFNENTYAALDVFICSCPRLLRNSRAYDALGSIEKMLQPSNMSSQRTSTKRGPMILPWATVSKLPVQNSSPDLLNLCNVERKGPLETV